MLRVRPNVRSAIAGAFALLLPVSAHADVDRLQCIAADMALTRGFDAMEGTQFIGPDGEVLSHGKSIRPTYPLTPTEERQVAPLLEELTPGATEFVDLWLIGPGSVGHSGERVITDKSREFIALVQDCLNTFGKDLTP